MNKDDKRPPIKKIDPKTIKRIFSYMKKDYKWQLVLVIISIILNTAADIASNRSGYSICLYKSNGKYISRNIKENKRWNV